MKPSSWDKQLGLALPLERAAGQSRQTNNPSKNEVGLDVSHHTRVFSRREGKPVKHATVHLSSSDREYNPVTDGEGRFSIWPVPAGKYSFAVKGWGEHQLEVKRWRRGK